MPAAHLRRNFPHLSAIFLWFRILIYPSSVSLICRSKDIFCWLSYYRQTIRSRYCPAVQFRLAKRSESDTDLASAFINERLAERDQQENEVLCIMHRCSRTAINGLHTTSYGNCCRPHKTSFTIYREMYQVTHAQENINKAQGK